LSWFLFKKAASEIVLNVSKRICNPSLSASNHEGFQRGKRSTTAKMKIKLHDLLGGDRFFVIYALAQFQGREGEEA